MSANVLISKADFGRQNGLGQTRLRRLIAEGLPIEGGKIDPKAGRAWLAQNLDLARKGNWGAKAATADASLADLRREREAQKIAAGALDLAKARSELVDKAAVRRFLTDRGRMERDAWLAWASAVSGRLASSAGVDAGRLFAALEAEVRQNLQALSERPLDMAGGPLDETGMA